MKILDVNKIDINENYCKITIKLNIQGVNKLLWIETESENGIFFCEDRCDGIIIMLLPELLLIGDDVYTDLAMSEHLFYNLNKLISVLVKKSKGRFKKINIHCPLTNTVYSRESKKNATGMSFGIDSFFSFASHVPTDSYDKTKIHKLNEVMPGHNVELLTFFNHGSLNGQYTNNSIEMREVFNRGKERMIDFANAKGISYLTIDSNVDEFYTLNYTKTHTFRTAGLVMCFQKLINNYYYSSGHFGDEQFSIDPFEDSARYDIFSLPMLGTENITLYSDGYDYTRFEKTEYLTYFDYTYKNLSVCWRDIDNCSECPKCVRTMATLELLGKLEEFSNVFDLDKYCRNHDWYWAKIISLRKADSHYNEIYEKAITLNHNINIKTKILAKIMTVARFMANPKILSFIQKKLKG